MTPKEDREANQKQKDLLTKSYQQRLAAGCTSPLCKSVETGLLKDELDVYVDPNDKGSAILALTRHKDYGPNSNILQTVFVQALTDKFGGPPQLIGDVYNHYWMDIPNSQKGAEWFACQAVADNLGDLQRQFPMVMNGFGNNQTKPPKCGMYVKAYILTAYRQLEGGRLDLSAKYVTEFTMTLVNVRSSYSVLSSYAANFWNLANKAKQDKLSKESQNKPRL